MKLILIYLVHLSFVYYHLTPFQKYLQTLSGIPHSDLIASPLSFFYQAFFQTALNSSDLRLVTAYSD